MKIVPNNSYLDGNELVSTVSLTEVQALPSELTQFCTGQSVQLDKGNLPKYLL